MKTIEIDEKTTAVVTQMREGDSFGGDAAELRDGNMIPRLCSFLGEEACKDTCQLLQTDSDWPGFELSLRADQEIAGANCAEINVLTTLEKLGAKPENFVLASCTGERGIAFGDDLAAAGAIEHNIGYAMVPATNAFFFRPKLDKTLQGAVMTHAGMRMADCGDVIYTFKDRNNHDVNGIAHFSRTNMRGPSAYMHELNGKMVSWGEYVLGSAVDHYGADLSSVHVTLVAAVDRKDFVHHFTDHAKMEKTFPGWNEVGFLHPQADEDFDCDVDYREMIRWQLEGSMQDQSLRLKPTQIDTSEAINTGNLSLGHASHRAAQKGLTEPGRDMYIVGISSPEVN